MSRRPFAIYLVCVVLVVLSAVLVPSCAGPAGTYIEVKATLDGSDWAGDVNYTLTPVSGSPIDGDSVPDSFSVNPGNWTCAYASISGGPDGAYLDDIAPSETQSVSNGGTITFTLNFKTLAKIAAHFMTPEGEPYPFDDVIISDGTWRKEFKNVTDIETEVPTNASYTFVYHQQEGLEFYRNFNIPILPGEVRAFEFYAQPEIKPRVRPYIFCQEASANASLSWEWNPDVRKLTWTLSSEPGKYVDLIFGIDDTASGPPNYSLLAYVPGGDQPIPSCNQAENHWENVPGAGVACEWMDLHSASYFPTADYPLTLSDITGYVIFDVIEPTLRTIRVGYGLYKDGIVVYPIDTTLRNLDGTIFEKEFIDPQYAVPPGSYILGPREIPEGFASLEYPINVAGKGTSINKFYFPKITELSNFTFLVAAESAFSHSSYSNLTHDEETDTVSVDVNTETNYDWWGCFVLPDTVTVADVHSHASGIQHDLVELRDYTINHGDGYNIVCVRITPEIDRLTLQYAQYAATSCVLDLTNNTLSPTNSLVTPLVLADGKAVVEIDMGAGNYSVLEMKIEIEDPAGDYLLNIGNSPTNNGGGGDAGQFSNDSELDVASDATNPNFILQLYANDYFTTPGAVLANLTNLFPPTPTIVTRILRVKIADQRMCVCNQNTGALRDAESPYIFRLGGPDAEAGGLNDFIYYAAFNRVIGSPDRTGSGVRTVTFHWGYTWDACACNDGWDIP